MMSMPRNHMIEVAFALELTFCGEKVNIHCHPPPPPLVVTWFELNL